MPEMCQCCGMNTAFEQHVSFWRSPEQAVVVFACSNCQKEFSRIKHASTIAASSRMTMLAFDPDDPYRVSDAWSPYTRTPYSDRPSVFRVRITDHVSWNRSRKTATLKDVVGASRSVSTEEDFTIEEVNLEIRSNP